ncbi:Permease of the drug/metabolite transporter (DMT) superfamily [Bathymodiolus heckerae thiotrophic gill symbiont]|nr:Permease of the drug/metabolite transporter (DMT) superfamily [Bathymodiolus heckerae thiotrophic gill symbiont]
MYKNYLSDILLLGVAIIWGLSYSLTKGALNYTSVLMFLVIRFGITFLLLMPFTIKSLIGTSKKIILYGSFLGLILSGVFIAEVYGIKYTTATNAAILISLSIVFTPFIDIFRTKNKPSKQLIIAATTSIIGIYILTYNKNFTINIGDILILIAAILRATMLTSIKLFTNRYSINSLTLTQIQMGVIFFVSLFLLLQTNQSILIPIELEYWLQIMFIIMFCTIFAFFAQNYGVRHSSPVKASFLMGTEPLFGVLFAIMFIGETLTINVAFGGFLIFIATLLGVKEDNKSFQPTANASAEFKR